MRDPERISDVLAAVERLWKLFPDYRLGQLLVNVCSDWEDGVVTQRHNPFHFGDEELVERIEAWIRGDQPT